ncbi:MAG: hypothetical protein NZ602_13570 [Thermoguttaceae bacterium]|nr:hypothetical protein [Thermoguttaceae bacterium]MDW8039241.1 hypothetical protein [Thermoguttaceae bacterium]
MWFFGYIGYQVLWFRAELNTSSRLSETAHVQQWSLISFYHILKHVTGWIFGPETNAQLVHNCALMLIGILLFSLAVLSRRIWASIRS